MGWGNLDDVEFKEFANRVNRAATGEFKHGVEKALTVSGQYLVGQIKARTPVATGGLRGAWHPKSAGAAGGSLSVTIENSKEYASFVEDGHRQTPGRYVPAIGKRLVAKWVPGQHMMRDAVEGSRDAVTARLQSDINRTITQLFGG